MADSDSTGDQWLEAQRRYWDAWMDMTRRGLDAATPAQKASANPWADAMEQWWKSVAPSTPKPAQDLLGQMVNLGKSYFSMAEGLGKMDPATDATQIVENWTRMMTEAFSSAGQGMNPFAGVAGKAGRQGLAFWDLPFDTVSRTMSAGMPFPGDFMKAFEVERPTDVREQMDRMLSAPALGYARESQEQHQKFTRLMLEYEQAMTEYQTGFGGLGSRSMEAFKKRLEDRAQEGGPVNSIREVFNIWVDACEEVYADYAMSDEYARRYGRMVNALMAVKHQGAQLVDEWLEAMNMPTRGDLGTVQRRLHDTRADYQRLRVQSESMRAELDAMAGLGSEVEELRAEMAELRKQVKAMPSKAAPKDETRADTKTEAAAEAATAGEGDEKPAAAKPAKKAAPKRARTASTTTRKPGTTRRKTQS
nr:class III poly(R)-hydroxyalkanoic acid synthase subunit PhaE [Thioalkalivibrio sp.]